MNWIYPINFSSRSNRCGSLSANRERSGTLTRKPKKPGAKKEAGSQAGSAQEAAHSGAPARRSRGPFLIAALVAAAVIILSLFAIMGLTGGAVRTLVSRDSAPDPATFVGSETCAGCHTSEADRWRDSQHAHAMQHATEQTVLGDFSDASFDYYGVHSRFFRKDGKFLVETDGPDGKLTIFEVKYTFGLDPLQQYLVVFPDGRLQALSLAWDARPNDKGGQRWFHLYPNEAIRHDDPLHWTKLNQNWNFMCAGCHSTGVRKNYDAANDRFATRFAEIGVGCEACHGQGSRHVDWAHQQQSWWPFGKPEDPAKGLLTRFDERDGITWLPDPRTGKPQRRIGPATLRKEVETCGLCHARRGEFSEDWVPGRWLSDTHVVSPIARGLYHDDGQMQDEVYNYGSFKQSRMFAAGVTCSDCHDPHSAKLVASGDNVCTQCHAADTYASARHSHHEQVKEPIGCASCHMPARTYMGVDRRHDHSFRIPRPDISAKLGTPNACNDCHADKTAAWASAAIEGWFGPDRKGFQNYAAAFHAAWSDGRDAATLLAAVASDRTPGFARAGALTELAARVSRQNVELAQAALKDPDPMVRIGGLDMLGNLPAAQLWPLVSPLLSDPVRGVRIRAATLLAPVPTARQPAADREAFEHAAAELVAAQHLNADRPEARTTLANFYARRGRAADAETEYKAALRLSRQFTPAVINLAELYRQLGRDADAEATLRASLAAAPEDAGVLHALGLTLVRLKRSDEALDPLRRAAELEPDHARYAYVYAVGLHSAGRESEALSVLEQNLARHPDDHDTLQALMTFTRDAGNTAGALAYAEQLARLEPDDRGLADLIQDLRRQLKKPEQ
jgi:predicted CXXCH cytochrome family protein